jgi:fatty acid desaturase
MARRDHSRRPEVPLRTSLTMYFSIIALCAGVVMGAYFREWWMFLLGVSVAVLIALSIAIRR